MSEIILDSKGIRAVLTTIRECYKYYGIEGEKLISYTSGDKAACVNYSKGILSGSCTIYYSDGKTVGVVCNFKNGELSGEYREYWPNGNLIIRCRYKGGILNGKYAMYNGNLSKPLLECRIVKGVKEGIEIFRGSSDDITISEYRSGLKEGVQQTIEKGKLRKFSSYSKGRLHGWSEYRDETGRIKYRTRYHQDSIVEVSS